MKLTLNLEEELMLLSRYNITSNELMFIRTLLILQDEDNEDLFKSYIEILYENNIKVRDVLLSLQDKEIILKSYKVPESGERFDPLDIQVNKNFLKNLYRCSFEMGKELFEAYPQFGNINGKVVGLRSISKKFDTLEDFYNYYGKSIKWNPEIHQHIMELLEWSIEYNIINYTLASFVIDQRWRELEALRDGEGNINYESITLL